MDVLYPSQSCTSSRSAPTPVQMQGKRSTFRIPNYRPKKVSSGIEAQVFHSRKSHRKSRGGCIVCKEKRVKCDEAKPHCLRCKKHGLECAYPHRRKPEKLAINEVAKTRSGQMTLCTADSSLAIWFVGEKMRHLLWPDGGCFTPKSRPYTEGASINRALEAFQHFHQVMTTHSFAENKMSSMMHQVAQLAFETPFLMHAVIGMAMSHLCNVVPDNSSYHLAEAFHWQETTKQYRNEIAIRVDQENMDKLFSACILLSVHSFRLELFNPRSSFVFSDDPTALNWLRLQGGLRFLLERLQPWFPRSMWWASFMESYDPKIEFEDDRPGRVGLNEDFANLCGIDETSTVDSNPYLWPLRMLTNLLVLDISSKNFQKYNPWMGRLEPEFLDCLAQKEPPALILLAWWLALMSHVDQWWMETRVRSECTAICMLLEDSQDPVVLKLLEFPANACGYLIRHVKPGDLEDPVV